MARIVQVDVTATDAEGNRPLGINQSEAGHQSNNNDYVKVVADIHSSSHHSGQSDQENEIECSAHGIVQLIRTWILHVCRS